MRLPNGREKSDMHIDSRAFASPQDRRNPACDAGIHSETGRSHSMAASTELRMCASLEHLLCCRPGVSRVGAIIDDCLRRHAVDAPWPQDRRDLRFLLFVGKARGALDRSQGPLPSSTRDSAPVTCGPCARRCRSRRFPKSATGRHRGCRKQ